jgi:hypothetical protein
MWALTKEEDDAWTARLVQLRASSSTEDKIVAILMETRGGFGLTEEVARRKAVEILLLRGLK